MTILSRTESGRYKATPTHMLARGFGAPSAMVQQHYVNVERLRLHYFSWGCPGPTIILLHGTGFHGYTWKPIAQGLSRNARVLAPDTRGHGDSGKPESGYSWGVFADDLHQFLVALHLSDVWAVGHSAGATAIALCAAAHPGRITRAVLIDPVMYPRGPEMPTDNPLAHRARKRRMLWESRTSMFHSYRTRIPFSTWREDVLWAYIEEGTLLRPDGRVELKCPGEIEAQIYEMAPHAGALAALPQVNVPVLLIRGESSDVCPPAHAEHLVSLLPHGSLKTIARTTHFVPMERPEAVERAVRKFFSL